MTKIQASWVVTLCRTVSGRGTTATQHHIPKDADLQQVGCDNLIAASVMFQSNSLCHTALLSKRQRNLHSANLKLDLDRIPQFHPEVHKPRTPRATKFCTVVTNL